MRFLISQENEDDFGVLTWVKKCVSVKACKIEDFLPIRSSF